MNEDRVKILAMLQEGKINVEEATRLLDATKADSNTRRPASPIAGTQQLEDANGDDAVTPTYAADTDSSTGAFLAGARLDGAKLDGAKLDGAFLLGADLRNADLRDADLRGSFLAFADLYNTNLRGANLNGAFMLFANGSDGDIAGVNWPGAFMPFTRFHQRKVQTV